MWVVYVKLDDHPKDVEQVVNDSVTAFNQYHIMDLVRAWAL